MKKIFLLLTFLITLQIDGICQFNNKLLNGKIEQILSINSNTNAFQSLLNNKNNKQSQRQRIIANTTSINGGGIISTLVENWENNDWVNYELTTFSFDLNKNETGYVIQDWKNNDWENSLKYGIILNEKAYPEIDSLQFWENNNWQNKFKHFYTYNSNNDVTEMLTQTWNDTTNMWTNLMKLNINYNDEYKITENYTEVWSDTGWSSFQREFYNYDVNTKLCTDRKTQMKMGDEWMDLSRITYSYNNENLKTEELHESWIFFQSKWTKSISYQYEYNGDAQEVTKIIEEWDVSTGAKTKYQKISTSYTNNFISEELIQEWGDNNWVNTDLNTYTIEDNQITVTLWQKWDSTNNKWYNFQRWTNTYGNAFSVETDKPLKNNFILSQNYPNPFNPTTTIKYSIPLLDRLHATSQQMYVQLKVYDVLGNEVATLVNEEKHAGNYQVTFNASNLASGIYYYTLKFNGKSITKKCLLIK